MRRAFALLATALLLFVGACNQQDVIDTFATPEATQPARDYIQFLRERNFARIEEDLDPELKAPFTPNVFQKMSEVLPAEEPVSTKVVGFVTNLTTTARGGTQTTTNTTFEFQYPDRWVVANIAIRTSDEGSRIVGLNVYPRTRSLAEEYAFTFTGKTPIHFLIFALALVLPAFTLYALILRIRDRSTSRRWPWIFAIIFGFGQFTLNWVTGAWTFNPFAFQLFSAGATADPYGPWFISLSLPIGALAYVVVRRARAHAPVKNEDAAHG